ncbi:hypothetical protein ACHAWC_008193 [Mediolabrus comicus]
MPINNGSHRSRFGGIIDSRYTNNAATIHDEDIDARCKLLLEEIDRINATTMSSDRPNNLQVESSLLHKVEQSYDADDYLRSLNIEIDQMVMSQAMTTNNTASRHRSSNNNNCAADKIENECPWTPYCDEDALAIRRKALFREIQNANDDKQKVISKEIQTITQQIKVARVDKELHDAYLANDEEEITVTSIHGFPVVLSRNDAIAALERERDKHLGALMTVQVIDDILQWMLDGWYFGQSSLQESSTTTLQIKPSSVQRGSLLAKANTVQTHSNAAAAALNSSSQREEQKAKLETMQTTTKYGLFCLTFSYFRALHLVRQQKEAYDISSRGQPISEERRKMIQEHKNAVARQEKIDYFMRKAKNGEEKIRQRKERERLEKKRISEWEEKRRLAIKRIAATVQRMYRGHLGRKRVMKIKQERQKEALALAYLNLCATDMQRTWRGYCGRRDAEQLRMEMAEFLFSLRVQEASQEEEQFSFEAV